MMVDVLRTAVVGHCPVAMRLQQVEASRQESLSIFHDGRGLELPVLIRCIWRHRPPALPVTSKLHGRRFDVIFHVNPGGQSKVSLWGLRGPQGGVTP